MYGDGVYNQLQDTNHEICCTSFGLRLSSKRNVLLGLFDQLNDGWDMCNTSLTTMTTLTTSAGQNLQAMVEGSKFKGLR